MEVVTQFITAIFVVLIFFGVIVGIGVISAISIIGIFRGIHNRNLFTLLTSVVVLIIIYVGVNTIAPKIQKDNAQQEVNKIEKENYIREWIFEDKSIAIEPAQEADISDDSNQYYVIEESSGIVYVVTIYPDSAFGLYKYKLEYFNDDIRME